MADAEKEVLPGGKKTPEQTPEQDERERRRVQRVLHYFFPFKGPGKEGSAEEGVGSGELTGMAEAARERRLAEVTQRLQVAREKNVKSRSPSSLLSLFRSRSKAAAPEADAALWQDGKVR
jgi:hypothetical protein